jgi:hypothetical protein
MCLRIINPPAKDSDGISDGIQIRVSRNTLVRQMLSALEDDRVGMI